MPRDVVLSGGRGKYGLQCCLDPKFGRNTFHISVGSPYHIHATGLCFKESIAVREFRNGSEHNYLWD